MASRTTEFKVGLTVLFALAALGWGIIWVKGYRYGKEVAQYRVLFPNVGALSAGDPVAVNGVTKGKVLTVDLERGKVVVSFEIDRAIELRSDATFTVKNIGLMGERFIEIVNTPPSLRDVAHRNVVRIFAQTVAGVRQPTLLVVSAIDNLVKGAAGQALQNANLMLGLDEAAGLPA